MLQLFGLYLLVGALLLGLTAFVVRLTRMHKGQSSLLELAQDMKPSPNWREKIFDWVMYPFVWLIWPVSLVALLQIFLEHHGLTWRTMLKKENLSQVFDKERDSPFTCHTQDLVNPADPEQIEQSSYVQDPLGRVPQMPFGHFHEAWSHLLSQMEPDDSLWFFNAPPRKWKPECHGYAVVRHKKIIAEFIFERI